MFLKRYVCPIVISAKRSTNAITTIQKNDVGAWAQQREKRHVRDFEPRLRDGITVAMFICSG
jgi:hypothetical protein